MNILELIEFYWPAWSWALPLVGIPCLALWVLFHALENPVLITLESEYILKEYKIEKGKPDSNYAIWCINQYKARPHAYNYFVTSLRLLYFIFVVIAILTTPVPFLVFVFVAYQIMLYSCVGNPHPIEKHARRIAESGIDELIDEQYRLHVLSCDSLEVGMDHIIQEIRNNELNPENRILSFLWHTKLKGDLLGKIADEKLRELGLADRFPE